MFQLDQNALAIGAIMALAGFAFAELRKPGKRQDQWIMMALAGAAAYVFRQYEGRGTQQETQQVLVAQMETRFEERFKTIFGDVHDMKQTLNMILERIGERPSPRRRGR